MTPGERTRSCGSGTGLLNGGVYIIGQIIEAIGLVLFLIVAFPFIVLLTIFC